MTIEQRIGRIQRLGQVAKYIIVNNFYIEQTIDETIVKRLIEACDVLISVGTSNLVWPATEVPRYAIRGGAQVIIVNPDMEGQPIGRRITYLIGASGEILPEVVSLAWR